MKKSILVISFLAFICLQGITMALPLEVFALDEEELLDDFTTATLYSYYTLRYTSSYYDFKNDREAAHNKFMMYKDIKGFEWDCSEPECHGIFVEALRQCNLSLIMADMDIYLLRLGAGDSADIDDAKNFLDNAHEQLVNAYIAWDNYLNPQSNIPGDINSDWTVNMTDLIITLQICAGVDPGASVNLGADVDGDNHLGMPEAIFILEKIAGMNIP